MKKSTLFKSIAAAALFVVGIGVNAQSTGKLTNLPALGDITKDATLETTPTETVSVNAYMPYKVTPDANIAAATTIFNGSGFKWAATDGTLYKDDAASGALTTSAVGAAYFNESTVYLMMPNSATPAATPISLSVAEKSNPIFSATAGCEGASKTLAITVVALPGLPSAVSDQGGCSTSSTDYEIPYNFSSVTTHWPYYFSYTISYTDLQGAASGTSKNAYYRIAASGDKFSVSKADLLAVKDNGNATPDLATGKYTITINNAWDQISVKALNRETAVLGKTTAQPSTLSSSVIIMPTPATGEIQHIKNLE